MNPIFFVVSSALLAALASANPQFPPGPGNPGCPDVFMTGAAFKISDLAGNTMTVANLVDIATVVGHSNPFNEGDPADLGAPICSAGVAPYAHTLAVVADTRRRPAGWLEGPATRREVHTEILALQLTNAIATIRAGEPFWASVNPGGVPSLQARFFRNSTGEVASNYNGNPANLALDFPARSFFNVYVEVSIPGMNLKLYNKTPLVLSTTITQFPPDLSLPNSTYIHDPAFGAVPLFDHMGLPFGWLLSAGHGSSAPAGFPLEADAVLAMLCPASFCVDGQSLGADPALTLASPNDVFGDGASTAKPVTIYISSGAAPGSPPDMTNARQLVGSVAPPAPPAFAIGDAVNSLSFGRDGTIPLVPCGVPDCTAVDGTLYFSVSRASLGIEGTDVNVNATFVVPEAAADLYISAVGPFGRYPDVPALGSPVSDNLMAVDNVTLGLRPTLADNVEDNVTALEMSRLDTVVPDLDFVYATFTGPTFAGNRANIYLHDQAAGPFQTGSLTLFAPAATMGLVPADIVDALVLSDASSPTGCPAVPNRVRDMDLDEMLFSLAIGSPTLWGIDGAPGFLNLDDDGINGIDDIGETGLGNDLSPAAVFRSDFDGTFSTFVLPGALGLLVTDEVDALDIKPNRDIPSACPCGASGPGAFFCAGDGLDPQVTTSCPCGNFGAQGNGCSWSGNPAGAFLTACGFTALDDVRLMGSGMPSTTFCIYLQGDTLTDSVFGDGIRCAGGSLLRLRTRANVGGASTFPDSTDTITLSARGGVVPGSGAMRAYQTYFRNAAPAFCPPATFNVTNGYTIVW